MSPGVKRIPKEKYMSENKKEIRRFSIISIWIGITIPIVAALIPYGYKLIKPDYNLVYDISDIVRVDGKTALRLSVINQGNMVESNVTISIKKSSLFNLDLPNEEKEKKLFFVETESNVKTEEKDKAFVIVIGDLRAKEKVDLSILVDALVFRRYNDVVDEITVKSKEHLGEQNVPSDFEEYVYPFGFWMFIILMALIFIAGIHQEYIMDPKEREKRLWDELEKIQKKIS